MPVTKDVIDVLKQGHRNLRQCFASYELAKSLTEHEASFCQLRAELARYAALEERFLFPVCATLPELSPFAAQAREEKTEREDHLRILDSYEILNDHWEEAFGELRSLVKKHLAAKEQWFFPRLRQLCDEQTRKEWGQQAEAIWQELAHAG